MTGMATAFGEVDDPAVQAVARHAQALVGDGMRIGLGSGRAAQAFVAALGARVRNGLRVVAVAASEGTARLARAHGIAIAVLGEELELDLAVDGADEVTPALDVLKGRGGALVRERIVCAAARRQVLLVGREKLVERLGERCPVPVEVIPFGVGLVARSVRALGLRPALRSAASSPAATDNGNWILDCRLDEPLADGQAARTLERALLAIPGVVDTGLFLGTAERVLVGHPDGRVEERARR
jgi:ribose 5-phosphate isomerase A